jgi:hypothetical protein
MIEQAFFRKRLFDEAMSYQVSALMKSEACVLEEVCISEIAGSQHDSFAVCNTGLKPRVTDMPPLRG